MKADLIEPRPTGPPPKRRLFGPPPKRDAQPSAKSNKPDDAIDLDARILGRPLWSLVNVTGDDPQELLKSRFLQLSFIGGAPSTTGRRRNEPRSIAHAEVDHVPTTSIGAFGALQQEIDFAQLRCSVRVLESCSRIALMG